MTRSLKSPKARGALGGKRNVEVNGTKAMARAGRKGGLKGGQVAAAKGPEYFREMKRLSDAAKAAKKAASQGT